MKRNSRAIIHYKQGSSSGRQPIAPLLNKFVQLAAKVKLYRQIAQQRRTLSRLSDHQLKDIGLTRDQARSEFVRGYFDIASQTYFDSENPQRGMKNSGQSRVYNQAKD